ncbi:MAG: efflux RND transporter periplasmic adaptor subunit [Betaproteobacteria bacterium]|jgi:multidrug efflux system membrane fusion protein
MRPTRLAPLIALALALAACGKKDEAAAPPGAPPAAVTTAPATLRQVVDAQEFPARLEAVEAVAVRSRITGYIQSIHFDQGAEVRRGDLLVTIDPRPIEARVARAEAELNALAARIDLARIELARTQRLMASQATSQRELDEKAAAVRDLEASQKGARAALDAARLDLSFTRITAPISGRVGKAEITAGNFVQTEGPESPVLTTLVSSGPIYAAFDVDERTFVRYGLRGRGTVKGGRLPLAVGLSGETGHPHPATLVYVDNRVDPQTGNVRMRALLDNGDATLVPGLYARVKMPDPAGGGEKVTVPDAAVGTDQDRKFVFVVGADRKAAYRAVQTAQVVDGQRVIVEGLKPGEQVIVNGLMRVRPGQPVTVTPDTPAPGARPAAAADKK